MGKDTWLWETLGATVVIVLIGAVTVHATVGWDNNGAAWVQAVGSVGAIVGAIVLARSDRRREARKDRALALVAGAAANAKIETLRALIQATKSGFSGVRPPAAVITQRLIELKAQLEGAPSVRQEDVLALLGNEKPTAVLLAEAQGQMQALQHMVSVFLSGGAISDASRALQWQVVSQVLEAMHVNLEVVSSDLLDMTIGFVQSNPAYLAGHAYAQSTKGNGEAA